MTARGRAGKALTGDRAGRLADDAALLLLLACLLARCHLGEVPFRTALAPAVVPVAAEKADLARADVTAVRAELARMTFAVVVLTAVALWLIGRAVVGRLDVRHPWLAALMLVVAAIGLASALAAADRRSALDAWLEQAAILAAGFLAAQLCADRRRFVLVLAVLAGLALAMGVKGLWQAWAEIPARIEAFEANREALLARQAIAPGTPKEAMFEVRVRDRSLSGFFPLANVFGSMMIVLVASGAALAAAKLAAAARTLSAWRSAARRGELHLPTLAGLLSAAAVAPAAAVLVMSRSRGAVASAAVAALVAAGVVLLRRRLGRHRRKALALAGAVWLAGAAATAGYGLRADALPTKTMRFRWHYWTASAAIIAERPLLGTGPGNFADAYLRHRRPAAEEAVKMPHNALLHAAAQYGLAGGLCYAAILVGVFVVASRRGAGQPAEAPPAAGAGRRALEIAVLAAAALAGRAVFAGAAEGADRFFLDALLPAAVLAGALVLARWNGGEAGAALALPPARIALACGLAGFLLHNMITFSLWTPGSALVFWVAAGACMGQAEGREVALSRLRWPLAGAAAAALVAAAALLWVPVGRKTALTEKAADALARGRGDAAAALAADAARADPLDPVAAADAARVFRVLAAGASPRVAEPLLADAARWAQAARKRNPRSPSVLRLAAAIEAERAALAEDGGHVAAAAAFMGEAARLDSRDARLRVEYAGLLLSAGRREDCLRQLDEAERLNGALPEESTYRFSAAELERIAALRREALPN
jgi:O-antigen ligase